MTIDDPNGNIDNPETLPHKDRRGRPAHWTPTRAAAWTDGINRNTFTRYSDDPELRDYWILGQVTPAVDGIPTDTPEGH
jgi:hypothetical protein